MKQIALSVVLVAALCGSVSACADTTDPKPAPTHTASPTKTPTPTRTPTRPPTGTPSPTPTPRESTASPSPTETDPAPSASVVAEEEPEFVYYGNCSDVREAGAAPIHRGEPGYSLELDRDGDGTACDS